MPFAASAFLIDIPTPEPMVLVEEISHRVVNEYTEAIAAVALAAADTVDLRARAALRDTARRLKAFAEAHRALQPPIGDIFEAGEYLRTICQALSTANLNDRGVRLTLAQNDDVCLPADQCWRLGLIVSELIANAARHGFAGGPGAIRVELSAQSGQLVCRVCDNGRAHAAPTMGRGRRLVEALAAGMGAEVDWSFSPHGSYVAVTTAFEPQTLPFQHRQ